MLTAALMLAAAFVAAPQAGPRLRPLPPPNDLLLDWLPIDEQTGFVDTCSSSVRLRQASCFSSWQVARSSGSSPLEPADSAVRTARTDRRCG